MRERIIVLMMVMIDVVEIDVAMENENKEIIGDAEL